MVSFVGGLSNEHAEEYSKSLSDAHHLRHIRETARSLRAEAVKRGYLLDPSSFVRPYLNQRPRIRASRGGILQLGLEEVGPKSDRDKFQSATTNTRRILDQRLQLPIGDSRPVISVFTGPEYWLSQWEIGNDQLLRATWRLTNPCDAGYPCVQAPLPAPTLATNLKTPP